MRPEFNFLHSNFFSGTFLDSSKAARRKLRCVPRGPYLDRFNPGSFHPCCCFKTAPRDTCASRQRISFVETAGRPAPLVDLHIPPFPSGNGGPIQLISGNAERPRLCLAKRCSFRFSWASPLFAHHFFGTEFSPTLEFFSPALTDARQFPIPVVGAQPTGSSDSGSGGW